MFADTPHLYKLLRNHLLDDGLRLPGGGVLDSQLFADVLAIDRGKEFRILPKLGTESHLRVSESAVADAQNLRYNIRLFIGHMCAAFEVVY